MSDRLLMGLTSTARNFSVFSVSAAFLHRSGILIESVAPLLLCDFVSVFLIPDVLRVFLIPDVLRVTVATGESDDRGCN